MARVQRERHLNLLAAETIGAAVHHGASIVVAAPKRWWADRTSGVGRGRVVQRQNVLADAAAGGWEMQGFGHEQLA